MAAQKEAQVTHVDAIDADVRRFELAMPPGETLGFVGGQYVIVDSGLLLPGGKAAKRAYSILSRDDDQTRFELAVRRIPGGVVSNYMHELSAGATVRFSGPWGKLGEGEGGQPTWIVATDTGITAALGLAQSSAAKPWLGRTTVLWLVASSDYFLSPSDVASRVPREVNFRSEALLPIGHPERASATCAQLARRISEESPGRVFLVGDGAIICPLSALLRSSGLGESQISVECFFNNPAKKAA